MTDTSTPQPAAKTNWLVDDVHWVLSHSWSLRFVFGAFVLSALEVGLPLILGSPATPLQSIVFAVTIGLTTGAAFVARLIAQKKEGVSGE
jgi:hypothetical protein